MLGSISRVYKPSLFSFCLALFAMLLCWAPTTSDAKDVRVGKDQRIKTIGDGILAAGNGGIVYIEPGIYHVNDLSISGNTTLIGEGKVVLKSRRAVTKGLLVPLEGASLSARNITFMGAISPDKNGAGIRMEGRLLRLDNCIFLENDNGILSTGQPQSIVKITNSKFINNGHGDGYSHGIYMPYGKSLTIENTLFEGTRIGHHIKSMAGTTTIRGNTLRDLEGQTSYMVDITKGGVGLIENNTMVRAANASQQTFINYDTSRGGKIGHLTIRNNIFENAKRRARLLRNPEKVSTVIEGNRLSNFGRGTLARPGELQTEIGQSQAEARAIEAQKNQPGRYTEEQLNALSPKQRRMVEKLQAQSAPRQTTAPIAAPKTSSEDIAPPDGFTIASRANTSTTSPVKAPTRSLRGGGQSSKVSLSNSIGNGTALISKSTRGLVFAPDFVAASRETLGRFNLTALNGPNRNNEIITFGQVFARGKIRPQEALSARFGESLQMAQMTPKTLYQDGSVKHAHIALYAPETRKSFVQGELIKGAASPKKSDMGWNNSFDLTVQIDGQTGSGEAFNTTISLASLDQKTWARGPLVTTYLVDQMAGPLLRLRGDLSFYANGAIRTRLTFENHQTFKSGNRDLSYRVKVSNGDTPVMQRAVPLHYRGSNWTEIIWSGALPAWQVQQDPELLRDTAAIPAYDFSYGVARKAINQETSVLVQIQKSISTGPFSPLTISQYMPATGSRPEIGILPRWDAYAFKTMDGAALLNQEKLASVGGAIPWHFEDDKTGAPVRTDQHPAFWAEQRGTQERRGKDRIPQSYFAGQDGGWTTDLAHKPAMTYGTYLRTADPYFARELAHEGAFAIASVWPEKRRGGTLIIDDPQLRARAWALRDIGNAAFILPDDAPLKTYFKTALDSNLRALMKTYVLDGTMDKAGETEGYFREKVDKDPLRISPWQNDFMVIAIGQEALRGSALAGEIIDWTSNFTINRIIGDGADPQLGIAYALHAYTGQGDNLFSTWSAMIISTRTRTDENQTYPNLGDGYLATALASLATTYSVTGKQDALQAAHVLLRQFGTTQLWSTSNEYGYGVNPAWLFATRSPQTGWGALDDMAR